MNGYYGIDSLVYILYWSFLLVFGVSFMHVQTLTRFFSSCPTIYWFAATKFATEKTNWTANIILFYFLAYFVIGSLMFTNFYPWT